MGESIIMDNQNSQDQITECAELGTYLREIARRIILKGETLRGIGQLWFESDNEELHILAELGMEIIQHGRNLKLLGDCLCNSCQMQGVETSVSVRKSVNSQ